jgi:two-component system chemotaxis sensor kinase CheA
LLDLEQKPDDYDLVDTAFRSLHTIKGSGAMFGFEDVAAFAHAFEAAFDRVRKRQAAPNRDLIVVALRAKDYVHTLIESPDTADTATGEDILRSLSKIVDIGAQQSAPEEAAVVVEKPATEKFDVRFYLPADTLTMGGNPLLMLDELRELGPCLVTALVDQIPMLDEIKSDVSYLGWHVALETAAPREAIEDVFMFLRDGMKLEISSAADKPRTEKGAEAQAAGNKAAPGPVSAKPAAVQPEKERGSADNASSLRVPAERLNELMDRVGELVIAQARLTQIASASGDTSLKLVAEELARLSAGLRDTTMGIRMVPIGTLFGRFRRLVHDLSHELGKAVEFETTGKETELDKTVVEKLADPLVHIIRNSIDHGLESGVDRVASGKPQGGTVRLSAVHSGAEVAISISDDGKGLDPVRIRAKAEEAGLIMPDEKLTDAQLFQMIFRPGFSTAREVTSISGRGVGMDVVKRTIESLRGSIDIASNLGKGTTVTLRLPLTLAIIEGMLVRVGKGRYTIPLSAVEECVELPASSDVVASGRNFLNIRGSLVPFLRLRELFGVKAPSEPYQKVVIIAAGSQRVGLVVDQIIGNNQTVIKSLSKLHAKLQTFSGATILGDGTVALILDVGHLVSFGQAYEEKLRSGITGRAA